MVNWYVVWDHMLAILLTKHSGSLPIFYEYVYEYVYEGDVRWKSLMVIVTIIEKHFINDTDAAINEHSFVFNEAPQNK